MHRYHVVAPWLHTLALAGVIVGATWLILQQRPSLEFTAAIATISRLLGIALTQAPRLFAAKPAELEVAREQVEGVVQDIVNGLTTIRGEVDSLAIRAARLRQALYNRVPRPGG